MVLMLKKNLWFTLLLAVLAAVAVDTAEGASRVGYYTLTMPSGTTTTMGDSSAILPITVNNLSGSTGSIAYVRLDFNANVYYLSNANAAPSGWTVSVIKNAGVGQTYIVYTTATNAIAAGGSQTFNVIVTGANNGNIPSAASDQTDSIVDDSNSTVMTVNAANSNYFDRNATGNSDNWQRKALYGSMYASPSSVGGGGTITITFTVTNRSSVTQAVIQPTNASLTVIPTGSASAVLATSPAPASAANVLAGESATFQWTYTANGSGSLQFCNFARNGSGNATSIEVCSNTVAVGDFTATLSITPTQVVTGQNVTITMTVTNTGSSALHNITPSALTFTVLSGSAIAALVSGPTPGSIGSLPAGSSSSFQWTYTITSTQVGSTFRFSGYATCGGVNSKPEPAYSDMGTVSAYSVTVAPDTSWYQITNAAFTFRVNNAGGYPIFKVRIVSPSTGFVYSTASGGCTAGWTVTTSGTPVQTVVFSTASTCTCGSPASCVPCVNGACDFSITYASLPDVSQNVNSSTDFNFRIDVWDTPLNNPGDDPRASLGVIIRITKNNVALQAIPDSVAPGCTAELISTVTPTPANGSVVSFSSALGTIYSATTTTGGEAYATFKAPNPFAGSPATVTATYQDVSSSATITLPNTTPCADVRRFRWQEINP